jgi:hypothetical protein
VTDASQRVTAKLRDPAAFGLGFTSPTFGFFGGSTPLGFFAGPTGDRFFVRATLGLLGCCATRAFGVGFFEEFPGLFLRRQYLRWAYAREVAVAVRNPEATRFEVIREPGGSGVEIGADIV